MRTIVWWSVWGLAVSAGILALLDSGQHRAHLLFAIPLLAGAAAAGLVRIKYEYHHAIQHAKWLGVSAIFLTIGLGYLYTKANAIGPFATGTTHKAFLGTTFEMSVPEVERALGQRLRTEHKELPLTEKAQEWLAETLPLPGHAAEARYVLLLSLYRVPCHAYFLFKKGLLGGVHLEFEPMSTQEADRLVGRIKDELAKDYTPGPSATVFRKEATEARLETESVGRQARVRMSLVYLPFADVSPAPLAVESNAF